MRAATSQNLRGRIAEWDETDVDREIANNLWKHHRMFPPNSTFKFYWDYAMTMLVLYNCVLTPMQLGYYSGPIFVESAVSLLVADGVIWLVFIGDILVNCERLAH